NQIHIFVMIGGTLLLLTGLMMGVLRPYLFQQYWFLISLLLFLIALAVGPIVLSPKSKPIKVLLEEHDGQEIQEAYEKMEKMLFFNERLTNVIFLMIIFIMITKLF